MNRGILAAGWALAGLLALSACKGDSGSAAVAPHKPVTFDTSPIDVDDFEKSPKVQRRCLYMPFGEAAARLGSLELEASSVIKLTAGTLDSEQADAYLVRQDPDENLYVRLDTPGNQIEVSIVDRKTYIRQDKGQMRVADNHDFQAPGWSDIAWSSLAQALEPFRPSLRFSQGRAGRVGDREAVRYDLGLAQAEPESKPKVDSLPPTSLAVTAPSGWRERAKPRELAGSLFIDKATGTPLKLSLNGRIAVDEKDGRVTEMRLTYEGTVKNVGKVAKISAPKAIPEFRIATPPADPVSFFREHLPPLPPKE
jgi:putative transposon-encoded protein